MAGTSTKIRLVIIIYWVLLLYVISALIWWYIALSRQNTMMADYKIKDLNPKNVTYDMSYKNIVEAKNRKTAQYIGEGSIFFLLIAAGAIFIYRAVRKEFKMNQQQQNFMMAVTHELKTPIAIAKLNLETIQKRKLNEEQQHKIISNTIQEANRMNDLCNNLLLSSQMEAGGYRLTPDNISLSKLIDEIIQNSRLRYQQRMFTAAVAENVFIKADVFLLQMAINNLIDNAVKYSPKESTVSVKLSLQNNISTISVADEGNGIADSEKNKVFDKYYRAGSEATQKAKGTGLGLFLVKRIVTAHKGKVYINDNTPKGSVFVIELNCEA